MQARTQDPARLDGWAAALRSGGEDERAAAAFALGQLGAAWEAPAEAVRARAEGALAQALAHERSHEVRERIVDALGKLGGASVVPTLTAALDGAERARAAVALSLVARTQSIATATAKLTALLAGGDDDARLGAALALERAREPSTRPALRRCLRDRAAHVRATCARALAPIGGNEEANVLAPLVDDADVRVAAEAARTLTKLAMKCPGQWCVAAEALRSGKAWPPAVMQAITFEHWRGGPAASATADLMQRVLRAPKYEARDAVVCMLAMAHDRAVGRIELLRRCRAPEPRRQLWMARALADAGGAALTKLAQSPYAAVRAAAAEGADAPTTLRLLGDRDPAVVEAAAERTGVLKLRDAAPALTAALGRLSGPDGVEAEQAILAVAAVLGFDGMIPAARRLLDADPYALRLAAAEALTALTHAQVHARLPALPPEPAPALPPTVVRFVTARGTIRARLWVRDAPRTAANLVALVRRRFFDGLTFHRVVPDFVSQGGDPKGDGSGGPGYMIPCEVGMRRYGAGVLGMALAGRDTGGSQFFFTHAPVPRLDGRYTAFGEVIEGLDVVTRLVEGDTILEARVE